MRGFKSCGLQFWRNFASITSEKHVDALRLLLKPFLQTTSGNLIVA